MTSLHMCKKGRRRLGAVDVIAYIERFGDWFI